MGCTLEFAFGVRKFTQMHYEELKQTISSYSEKGLEQRRNWYSPAAEAYNKARPRYPRDLIGQVVDIARLSSNSKILEVGYVVLQQQQFHLLH